MAMEKFCLFILIALSVITRIRMQDIEPQPIPAQPRPTTESSSTEIASTGEVSTVAGYTESVTEDSSTIFTEFTTKIQTKPSTDSVNVESSTEASTILPIEIEETTLTQLSQETTLPTTVTTKRLTSSTKVKDVTTSTPRTEIILKPNKPRLGGSGLICWKLLGEPRYYYNYWSPSYLSVVRSCRLCCSFCGVLQYCLNINPVACRF